MLIRGDKGATFNLHFIDSCTKKPVDISLAESKIIALRSPDERVIEKPAGFLTDGTDGIITYTVRDTDFHMSGVWSRQGIVITSSDRHSTNIVLFTVTDGIVQ